MRGSGTASPVFCHTQLQPFIVLCESVAEGYSDKTKAMFRRGIPEEQAVGEVFPLLLSWHAWQHDLPGSCSQQTGVCSSVSGCNHVSFNVLCRFCCHHSCCCHLEMDCCMVPFLIATSHPLHAHTPSRRYLCEWKSRRARKRLKSLHSLTAGNMEREASSHK